MNVNGSFNIVQADVFVNGMNDTLNLEALI